MRTIGLLLASGLLTLASTAAAVQLPSQRANAQPTTAVLAVKAIDVAKALAEDAAAPKEEPLRYAIGARVAVDVQRGSRSGGGQWQTLRDGRRLWRLYVDAPGAMSVDLGFTDMFLPHGAELYVASVHGKVVRGPYTDAHNPRNGRFFTPVVPGDGALVELVVPAELERHVSLELSIVRSGYRYVLTAQPAALAPAGPKSLSCHIDTVCPEGDPVRDEIRGVAGYTFGGINGVLCTGTLLNNVRGNSARLFSSANHCVDSQATADSVVVYWKYESPVCRPQGSSASGTPVDLSVAIPHAGGAQLLATHPDTDMTLLELRQPIPSGVNPYFNGWDRRDSVPQRSTVIHHSGGDEKRLAFDDNPAVLNTGPVTIASIQYAANASVDVTYDRMTTTEGGASGAGLFDQNNRVVGQLGGGPEGSCTTSITDTYGRYAVAWDGGGTPASRLSSWLDPDATGAQFLDGRNACPAPTINLTGPATGTAGTPQMFSVQPSGTGPFVVEWDVDGDGVIDRRQANVTGIAAVSPSFPLVGTTNVSVDVTDATGCTGTQSRAFVVTAHDVVATVAPPQQVCGDSDATIEPGESWRVPVTLRNQGNLALVDGVAVFTESSYDRPVSGTGDAYGYLLATNATSPDCDYQFVDIGTTGTLLETSSDDDGATEPLPLGPAGLNFYGTHVDALVMSTNGYLSTSPSDDGGDFDNTCALEPPDNGGQGGHIRALHDDLVAGAGSDLRRQYFATCPRPSDAGGGARGCTVFQWSHMTRYISATQTEGDFTFQAIVYDGSDEIVYQYLTADPLAGGSATISIQNDGATDRLQHACNTQGAAPAGRAVCFFHPEGLPPSPVELRTVSVPLGNLAAGGELAANVDFHVPATATCGARLDLGYVGAVDDLSASMRSAALLATTVGAGGTCAPVSAGCGTVPATPAAIAPQDGLYANPNRFGNGTMSSIVPQQAGPSRFFGMWFTGDATRRPTWYVLDGAFDVFNGPGQVATDVQRFTLVSAAPFSATSRRAGRAQITTVSATEYVLTFTLDGEVGGEKQSILYPGARPTPNRTGIWANSAEPGWYHVIDDHRLNGTTPEQVGVNLIYDASSTARWTLGASPNLAGGPMNEVTYLVQCPTCASFSDFIAFPLPAGSSDRAFSSLTQGTLTTAITWPAPMSGTWSRSAAPIRMLTVPAPQAAAAGARKAGVARSGQPVPFRKDRHR